MTKEQSTIVRLALERIALHLRVVGSEVDALAPLLQADNSTDGLQAQAHLLMLVNELREAMDDICAIDDLIPRFLPVSIRPSGR